MDKLLTFEFWKTQGTFVMDHWAILVPLLLLAGLGGWKFKGAIDAGEIAKLKATIGEQEQRVLLAREASASVEVLSPKVAQLRVDLDQMQAQITKLEARGPEWPEVIQMRAVATTSIVTVGSIAEAVEGIRRELSTAPRAAAYTCLTASAAHRIAANADLSLDIVVSFVWLVRLVVRFGVGNFPHFWGVFPTLDAPRSAATVL